MGWRKYCGLKTLDSEGKAGPEASLWTIDGLTGVEIHVNDIRKELNKIHNINEKIRYYIGLER